MPFAMRRRWLALASSLLVIILSLIATPSARALDQDTATATKSDRTAREAVVAGLKLLERSARQYPQHRKCFGCHHQTFPLLASNTAKAAGIEVDAKLPDELGDFTRTYLKGRVTLIRDGQGIPGRAFMASYAAWTLRLNVEAHTETQEAQDIERRNQELDRALVTYLLKTQQDDGHWKPPTQRPPLEESLVTGTVLARSHLKHWRDRIGEETERSAVDVALARSDDWLAQAKFELNEDHAFRLWGLVNERASSESIQPVRERLLQRQLADGGWAQRDGMTSDAYATGQAIYALKLADVPSQDEALQRGVQFLLKSQAADGSWFVETRSKPIQEFFDNGDPYGKHQFISITATGWAVTALAKTLP